MSFAGVRVTAPDGSQAIGSCLDFQYRVGAANTDDHQWSTANRTDFVLEYSKAPVPLGDFMRNHRSAAGPGPKAKERK